MLARIVPAAEDDGVRVRRPGLPDRDPHEEVEMPQTAATVESPMSELIQSDETFRQLYEEHLACKQRLHEMRQQTLPSEEDEAEMKRIKLHKLSLKDQMEAIRRQHEHAVTH